VSRPRFARRIRGLRALTLGSEPRVKFSYSGNVKGAPIKDSERVLKTLPRRSREDGVRAVVPSHFRATYTANLLRRNRFLRCHAAYRA
jgi:hypothetical protein